MVTLVEMLAFEEPFDTLQAGSSHVDLSFFVVTWGHSDGEAEEAFFGALVPI